MYGCTAQCSSPGGPGTLCYPLSRRGSWRTSRLDRDYMGRGIYVDCFSGASGDMLLGALLDAGVSLEQLRDGLRSLPVTGWRLEAEPARQHGLGGTRARVKLTEQDQPHRGLSEVLRIVHAGGLP